MLEAHNIHVNYGARAVLKDIDLRCAQGELISVIGPNGAGKSTLLRTLNGGLVPSRGDVLLDEQPIRSLSRRAVARRIATVAQDADVRFPVTVLEFILGGRYAWSNASSWGWENAEDVKIAMTTVRETELEGFEARLMNQLSGGERQRAILARALATEAKMYLLDEPTANLDLAHQATILALVRKRCDSRGDAAIVVTHDINLAAEFSDRVLLIKKGQTVAFGQPGEVFTAELLKEVFSVEVLVDAHPVSGAPRVTPVHSMNSTGPY